MKDEIILFAIWSCPKEGYADHPPPISSEGRGMRGGRAGYIKHNLTEVKLYVYIHICPPLENFLPAPLVLHNVKQ